jgi:PAS domain S-box-containing protein
MGGPAERPPDATVVVGPRGFIEDADDGACRLLGYSRAELVGLHGSELVPRDAQAATAASIDRMRRGDFALANGRLIRKGGEEIAVQVSARPLPEGRIALSLRARHVARGGPSVVDASA